MIDPGPTTEHRELDVVLESLIDEVGPAVLTSAAVARRLGMSVHALRRRYGGRDALLLGYNARSAHALTSVITGAAERADGPLVAIGRAVAATLPADATAESVAHRLAWRVDPGSAALRAASADYEQVFRDEVRRLIDRAVAAGSLSTSLHGADELTDVVVTTYHGAIATWLVSGEGSVRAWVVQRVERALRPHRV